jgi:hypothetical protein
LTGNIQLISKGAIACFDEKQGIDKLGNLLIGYPHRYYQWRADANERNRLINAEMNGTEFLRRVRDSHTATVRLALSGYTDLESITDAINRGAIYKFLTKP